jgi:archaellum component FlaG (FlaF/FlaG flagellin family)
MSTTSPSSRRSQSGSARAILVFLLAVVMFAAGAATSWWYITKVQIKTAAVPSPSAPPNFGPLTPSTLAAPEAQPSAAALAGETAAAPVAPPVTSAAAPVAAAAGPAPTTRRPARPPVAATPAPVAPGPPVSAQAGGGRNFVLGTTVVESLRAVGRDLQGFESTDVGVKRAPKVEGLLDLVMQPAKLKAGDPYAVQVFLKNDGKKPIEVDEMKVSMIVDGKWSTRPLPAKVKQIAPKQRVLLEELPGIWKGGVNDWAVEAVVTSKNQDVYRNRLTWK